MFMMMCYNECDFYSGCCPSLSWGFFKRILETGSVLKRA